MTKKSTFGKDPERLKRLLSVGFEEKDAGKEAATTASLEQFMEKPGGRIGRYQLLSDLGEGGMGIVYLAEQKRPIRRQVALKVIKPGMDSKRVIARFEAERQALALLDHPNIAHVYDAGTTENGRPYFVMEYVKGLSITEHCDRHKLTIEDRLNLFRQVCQAVHHAHQKGIIHRDIKPSNILISTQDDEAVPKIIDFGVAKALAQPLTERTLVTEHGQLFGTPEYMSPEQADMANEDIDTRSDIYSLGVLLYVLLTGVLPFDSDTLRTGGIEHIRQVIRETDPKTPSTRLSSLGDEAKKVARSRRIEVAALAKCLHKELEWIPLKAMRKERSERYRSASEFVDDIDNYLEGAPLLAGPPSTVYRLKKFVLRNRALVAGIMAVAVSLMAGFIVTTALYFRAERLRAEAQLVTDFLQNDLLGPVHSAAVAEVNTRYVLDTASRDLKEKFKNNPLLEARLSHTLGNAYAWRAGDYKMGELYLERSYYIYLEHLGEDDHRTILTMNSLALVYSLRGKYGEAEVLFEKVIALSSRGLMDAHDNFTSFLKGNLAVTYAKQGQYEDAERLFSESLDGATWGKTDVWRLNYTRELADVYREWGRYDDAAELYELILDAQSQNPTTENRDLVVTMSGLGHLRTEQGRYELADELLVQAKDLGRRRFGDKHPDLLTCLNHLAVLRTKQEKYAEAERLFHEVLEARKDKLGDDHPDTLESKNYLAVLYKEKARYDVAEPLLLEALEGRRLKLGDQHPHTLESWKNLIELYKAWGKPEKAAQLRKELRIVD